jgi:hypothetical protein
MMDEYENFSADELRWNDIESGVIEHYHHFLSTPIISKDGHRPNVDDGFGWYPIRVPMDKHHSMQPLTSLII